MAGLDFSVGGVSGVGPGLSSGRVPLVSDTGSSTGFFLLVAMAVSPGVLEAAVEPVQVPAPLHQHQLERSPAAAGTLFGGKDVSPRIVALLEPALVACAHEGVLTPQ